jgi:hypothetical protein
MQASPASESSIPDSAIDPMIQFGECAPSSFLRLPSWRWRLARSILDDADWADLGVDAWVEDALAFLQALTRHPLHVVQGLSNRFREIDAARTIFSTDDLSRWHLEARLLTGETLDTVASKCVLPLEVVRCYAAVFYDVRDRLDWPTYVICEFVGPKIHIGLEEDDFETFLKFYGYRGGGLILDWLVEFVKNPPVIPERIDLLDEQARVKLREALLAKVVFAAATLPVEKCAQKRQLLHEAWKIIEDKDFDTPPRARDAQCPSVDSLSALRELMDRMALDPVADRAARSKPGPSPVLA